MLFVDVVTSTRALPVAGMLSTELSLGWAWAETLDLSAALPLAAVGNAACWAALLSRTPWLHAFENSVWGRVAAATARSAARARLDGPVALALAWLLFLAAVDVPRWWSHGPTPAEAELLRCTRPLPLWAFQAAELVWQFLHYGAVVVTAATLTLRRRPLSS